MTSYVSTLYCGRDKPGHPVTDAEVGVFEDSEVAGLFPSGWTRYFASGGWKSRSRMRGTIREDTVVFQITHNGNPDDLDRLEQLAARWKALFEQDSVLITTVAAQVTFV